MPDNIMHDAAGQPIVPFGTEKPLSQIPKDTLPRPSPQTQMPEPQVQQVTAETIHSNAVEGTITFGELAVRKGFKSPDDMAKAYANLESQTKRVEATLSDAMQARIEAQRPFEEQKSIEEVNSTEDALRIVDSRIDKRVNAVVDKIDYQMHILSHPDDQQYASDAIRIVKDNPGISWNVAFRAAKADHLEERMRSERETGKQEAYSSIQNKQNAQSVHAASPNEAPLNLQDLIQGIRTGRIPLSEAKRLINSLGQ